jgi:hypothetical protein
MVKTYPFLENFDSVIEKRVYDVAKRTMADWYTSRTMESDALYEDFAKVSHGKGFSFLDGQGTEHDYVFLRDVFNEKSIDPLATPCAGPKKVSLAEQCIVFSEIDLAGGAQKHSRSVLFFVTFGAVVISTLSALLA